MATRQQSLFVLMVVAVAFATSSLTQLRFGALPLGVPELVLLGCMIAHLPLGGGLHVGTTSIRFLAGLFLLYAAMMPGFFLTLITHGLLDDVMHNLVAMTWVLLVFAYLQFGFDFRRGELEWLCGLVLAFSCVYFAFCLALAYLAPETVFTVDELAELNLQEVRDEDMLATQRLVGFSKNPNQLGLHAIVALFFCLRMWRTAGTIKSTLALGVILATGFLTGSDSFLLGAALMIGMAVVFGLLFSGSVYTVLMLLVPVLVAAAVLYPSIVARVNTVISAGDQDLSRFALIENGWLAMLERPLVGWGPGNWSGLSGPLEFIEAHNSLIDYLTMSGLLGGFVVTFCLGALLLGALRARQATLVAGICGVVFFALFHNALRQPLMWLALFYAAHHVWPLKAAVPERRRRRRRHGVPRSRPTTA